jgi:hypothetical protein
MLTIAEELSQASGGTIKRHIDDSRGGKVSVSSDVATVSMKLSGLNRDFALKIAELLREA